jgi:transcriptional regulator with XRE-family HTH domain
MGRGGLHHFDTARIVIRRRAVSVAPMLTTFLRAELDRRQARNPRYSLRALARDLGLHHATLSRLLRQRRRLTAAAARALAARLDVPATVVDRACGDADDAAVIAAVRREGFVPSSRYLATRSGLPLDAINAALFRLLRAGILSMPARDRWETHA